MKTLLLFLLLIVPYTAQNIGTILTQKEVSQIIQSQVNINNYIKFKERLGLLESSGQYNITNPTGSYLGKYQFGKLALKDIGATYSKYEFLKSKYLQEHALYKYLNVNKRYLSRELKRFVGTKINGIRITVSGLLAAAHLGGAGSVKQFLYSDGQSVFADGNGTEITKYLKEFSNYNFTLNVSIENYIVNQYT